MYSKSIRPFFSLQQSSTKSLAQSVSAQHPFTHNREKFQVNSSSNSLSAMHSLITTNRNFCDSQIKTIQNPQEDFGFVTKAPIT